MSTPTTATATLAPYPHHHHHSGGYHFTQQPYAANPASYRSNLPPPVVTRLPGPSYSTSSNNSTSSSHTVTTGTNGVVNLPSSTTRSTTYRETPHSSSRHEGNYTNMSTSASSQTQVEFQDRKRRRSKEVDWREFYKHGLPKEIIVIDDSPEPPQHQANAHHNHKVNGINGTRAEPVLIKSENGEASSRHHQAKKRKRDDEGTRYDPVHNRMIGSRTNDTPSGSTISSGRTDSAIHTTAATSLGSLSSNSQYEHEVQPGQKRKRTRQQIANEAKRREVGMLGHAYTTYQPPPQPPKKAPEVTARVEGDDPNDSKRSTSDKCDDEDGHYIVTEGTSLTKHYQTIKLLGQGTFGKVVQARDRKKNELVAIKIIRSVQKYRDASKIELKVLQTLKLNDAENRNRCIHLRDCFDYRGHICIVMDLLGQSVFDFLKGNNFVPFPNSQIQSFARQLFTSVAFLHDLNLIHTDLKPENILLADSTYQTFTYNRKIPSSSNTVARQATQRRVLLDTEIRLIDFGSATFQDEYHSSVVSTRHYRAPEIILGLGWSYPCDIWSIGCILVEFFTGDALFQTHDNLEHLAMMEAVCDCRIKSHLIQQVNRTTRSGGNAASKFFKKSKLDYPQPDTSRASKRFVKAMKRLSDIIPHTPNNPFMQQFLDLLKRIFVYDPIERITAKEALQHAWFREVAHPDDGTEAARIRIERLSTNREGERGREREREREREKAMPRMTAVHA